MTLSDEQIAILERCANDLIMDEDEFEKFLFPMLPSVISELQRLRKYEADMKIFTAEVDRIAFQHPIIDMITLRNNMRSALSDGKG